MRKNKRLMVIFLLFKMILVLSRKKNARVLGGVVRVVVKNCLCVSVVKLEVFFLFWVLAVPIVTQRFRECFPGGR